MKIHIQYRTDGVELTKGTEGSAGWDVRSTENVIVMPNRVAKIGLGFSLEIPKGYVGIIAPRSSFGLKGISCPNSVGVIDSDYRGEICMVLYNNTNKPFEINKGDRIGQLLIIKHEELELISVNSLPFTSRGAMGFGSTGVK